ncbi:MULTISPECIES: ATP-binding protein [unclassified Psychrobacter]|uniref:ATP-binding protein n=1 Tax=unclassified Psychrobacter TaxID=196806 RepID=UPI0019180021|nr:MULTISPECIES: ATP-binding protein [unclassified Psychrobacter]
MIYKLILNKHLQVALLFLLIQQIIVASSTYFIARLAQSLTEESISILYMVLFAVSLVAVYVPAYFCVTNTERAKYDAHKLYNDNFHTVFLGKTYLLSNDELQSTATTTLAQESNYTLETVIDSIFDISALVLNVLFNVLVIAWFLDGTLLLGYAVGIIFASMFVHFRRHALKTAAKTDQQSRLNLTAKLFDSWDNVVIFNKHNYTLYNNMVQKSFATAKNNSVKSTSIQHINSSLGMIILMLPVFVVTAFIFNKNWQDAATMAVLIATLPRQIQLLQMCYALIGYHTSIGVIRTMLDGILEVLQPTTVDLDTYIQANQIRVKQTGDIFDSTQLPKQGRVTLVGNNGVGKSCMLLKLKDHYQEQAYYLPAKHNLYFNYKADKAHKGSTGQQLIKQIQEIREDDRSTIVMLDEWDAHLDRENTQTIDQYLDELAQTRLVVDVRH